MSAPSTSYTLIKFMYADGANYKNYGRLIGDGVIRPDRVEAMRAVLETGDCFFIPTQLGLGHLGEQMVGFPDEDDHCWHSIDLDDVETTADIAHVTGIRVGDINAFADLFVAEGTKGWDDTVEP